MSAWRILALAACVVNVALVAALLRHIGRSRMALPMTLLCVDFFVWNFAELVYDMSGNQAWHWLDISAAPLALPLTLHVVLYFVGRRRQLAWLLYGSYAIFGVYSLFSLAALLGMPTRFTTTPLWNFAYLAGMAPLLLIGIVLVTIHLKNTHAHVERLSGWVILSGLVLGATLGSTNLLPALGLPVPRLANLAALLVATLLAFGVYRLDLIERTEAAAGTWAVIVGLAAVAAELVIVKVFRTNLALLIVLTSTVVAGVLAITRYIAVRAAERRRQLGDLALVGRFSAQLAHDLRNPLAALRGTVELLQEERRRGSTLDPHGEYLELAASQIHRMERIIDDYLRLARLDIDPQPLQLNELVTSLVQAHHLDEAEGLQLQLDLATDLPDVPADRDLLTVALENLVRNAREAMPEGGTLTLRTERAKRLRGQRSWVVLSVEDTGTGMDARARERATEEFFTTKAQGSGLGLAFVRRFAEAHGGMLSLESELQRGTRIDLQLPVSA